MSRYGLSSQSLEEPLLSFVVMTPSSPATLPLGNLERLENMLTSNSPRSVPTRRRITKILTGLPSGSRYHHHCAKFLIAPAFQWRRQSPLLHHCMLQSPLGGNISFSAPALMILGTMMMTTSSSNFKLLNYHSSTMLLPLIFFFYSITYILTMEYTHTPLSPSIHFIFLYQKSFYIGETCQLW